MLPRVQVNVLYYAIINLTLIDVSLADFITMTQ